MQPGEEGEIVLTTMSRDASPLLRFATDDKAMSLPSGSCPCHRPFAAFEAGTIARYDDMLKIKMVNIWPTAVDALLFAYPEIAEYQGRVFLDDAGYERVLVAVEFKLATSAERKADLKSEVETSIQKRLGVHMEFIEAEVSLPRFEFKARRWTDERKQSRERVLYRAH